MTDPRGGRAAMPALLTLAALLAAGGPAAAQEMAYQAGLAPWPAAPRPASRLLADADDLQLHAALMTPTQLVPNPEPSSAAVWAAVGAGATAAMYGYRRRQAVPKPAAR